jgi:hypothetical protein
MSENDTTDEFNITLVNQIPSDFSQSIKLHSGEDYFGIEMSNLSGHSLNAMMMDEKAKLAVSKLKKPANIRLKRSDMPKQTVTSHDSAEKYRVYVNGGIDSFYVFNARGVNSIQVPINDLCVNMAKKLSEEYEEIDYASPGEQVAKGDLVFSKSDDEDQWFRCIVSDFDETRSRFSVFSVDLGNMFTVERKDLMYAWSEEQASILSEHMPQAFRSQLYALSLPLDSTTGKSSELKNIVANKEFSVRFLNSFSDKETDVEGLKYDVCLSETSATNSSGVFASVHLTLVHKGHGKKICLCF